MCYEFLVLSAMCRYDLVMSTVSTPRLCSDGAISILKIVKMLDKIRATPHKKSQERQDVI